jgi:hypothetical protein
MRIPNAAELLEAWEHGLRQSPTQRVLGLLATVCPEAGIDELASLSIGRRDALLLDLRQCLFGADFSAVGQCPACELQVESSFRSEDIRFLGAPSSASIQTCVVRGCRVAFRLPDSRDLITLGVEPQPERARAALLARCITETRDANGETVSAESLPADVVAEIAAQMLLADPQADIQLTLACPACEHCWQAVFDIAGFLWREIHAWAQHTLRDVHSLARAYGWREMDVLALSPTRRQFYLELCRQ